mgnify:CR=1 FL=1
MSVAPSRPFATNASGGFHPVAKSAEASAFSSVVTSFWSLVRRLDPDMDAARRWLRRNGAALHRFGCED